MPSEHAKFSPSSMKRVIACPASFAHEQAIKAVAPPGKSSDAAREGTIAHALGELALRKSVDPRTVVGRKLVLDLDGGLETVVIEKEMADHVLAYTEHCNTLAMLAERRYVEQEVHVTTTVHGAVSTDLLWGTADFIAIAEDRIDVVDLKYGGQPVFPEDNSQLICYLLGALELLPEDRRPNKGAVHIVQPRVSREPKIWEIDDLAALKAEWLPRLEAAMTRAVEASMLTAPVEGYYSAGEHCHFCSMLVMCDHFAKHMIDLTAEELEEIEPPRAISPDRYAVLVERWKTKGILKKYFEALEDRLMGDIRSGLPVPGVKIVESLGHRRWTLDDEAMKSRLRARGLKKKDFIVETIISPTVAEKLINNEEFFKKYVTRNRAEKLALSDDKRPAVNPAAELEPIGTDDFMIDITPTADGYKVTGKRLKPSSPTMALIDLGETEEGCEVTSDLYLGSAPSEIDLMIDLGLNSDDPMSFADYLGSHVGAVEETEETEETIEL